MGKGVAHREGLISDEEIGGVGGRVKNCSLEDFESVIFLVFSRFWGFKSISVFRLPLTSWLLPQFLKSFLAEMFLGTFISVNKFWTEKAMVWFLGTLVFYLQIRSSSLEHCIGKQLCIALPQREEGKMVLYRHLRYPPQVILFRFHGK